MSIYLDVPFVSQLTFGGDGPSTSYGPPGSRDPSGCWYAAACMVGYFFEAGPRQGVPSLNKPGGGHAALQPALLSTFAKNENLEPVAGAASRQDGEVLEALLRDSGPIWFAWNKTGKGGRTYPHASVLIGVDASTIIYHDPEDEPKARMTIGQLNWRRPVGLPRDSGMLRRAGPRTEIHALVLRKIVAAL